MLTKIEFTKDVGKRIRKWRVKRGMSQEELAHQTGLYRTYIGHLENARYSPSAYILFIISKVLKINIAEFFPQ